MPIQEVDRVCSSGIVANIVAGIGTFHSKSVVANPSDCLLSRILPGVGYGQDSADYWEV